MPLNFDYILIINYINISRIYVYIPTLAIFTLYGFGFIPDFGGFNISDTSASMKRR